MSIKPEKKILHLFCRITVGLLSFALICGTAVPLLRSDAWWIRVFDFPRIQIASLIGLTLAGYAALRELIGENDPDIILLSEPTQWWLEQLDGLEDDYPFTLFQPQENHYGKLLYSRLALENPEIRFLIDPKVPSIRSRVRLRSGTLVTLYGVHPSPPGLKRPDGANEAIDKWKSND